jgi:hypothetical protein
VAPHFSINGLLAPESARERDLLAGLVTVASTLACVARELLAALTCTTISAGMSSMTLVVSWPMHVRSLPHHDYRAAA